MTDRRLGVEVHVDGEPIAVEDFTFNVVNDTPPAYTDTIAPFDLATPSVTVNVALGATDAAKVAEHLYDDSVDQRVTLQLRTVHYPPGPRCLWGARQTWTRHAWLGRARILGRLGIPRPAGWFRHTQVGGRGDFEIRTLTIHNARIAPPNA